MNKLKLNTFVAVLFPVVLALLVYWAVPQAVPLKADSNIFEELVHAKVNGESISAEGVEVTEKTVSIELTSEENCWLKIPRVESVEVAQTNESGHESPIAELSEDKFDFSEQETLLDESIKQENIDEENNIQNKSDDSEFENVEEFSDPVSSLKSEAIQLIEVDGSRGDIYIRLIENKSLSLTLRYGGEKTRDVQLQKPNDENQNQRIVTFVEEETFEAEGDSTISSEIINNPEDSSSSEIENLESKDVVEEGETGQKKSDGKILSEEEISNFAVSLDTPFDVSVDVGAQTGVAPFDSDSDPGYDQNNTNNKVRTFDQVNYNINVGLTNTNDQYASFIIQLDTEMEGAWRLDSSGKVRRTAELSNGTLTDTGSGTKKTSHSTQLVLDSSGQAFFTESLDTFGGVNGDELNMTFKVTLVSATKTNGEVVPINQVIDSSIEPQMNIQSIISAKPNVDVKLAQTSNVKAPFNNLTKSTDKPNSLVTNVGAYVQLKPLPGRTDITSLKGVTYPVGGIEYTIDQSQRYNNSATGTSHNLIIGVDNEPVEVLAYSGINSVQPAPSEMHFTTEYEDYSSDYSPLTRFGLSAPYGKTLRVYPDNYVFTSVGNVGVYDTGNPEVSNTGASSITIKNFDYSPVSVGKQKGFISGGRMPDNAEPFSVVGMQVVVPYDYLENQIGIDSSILYTLSVSNIQYEGQTQQVNSTLNISWNRIWPGSIRNYSKFYDENKRSLSSDKTANGSAGDSITTQGNKIWVKGKQGSSDPLATTTVLYTRWNAGSLSYDTSRDVFPDAQGGVATSVEYGVGTTNPDTSLRTRQSIDGAYTWFPTPEEAQAVGEISAVRTTYDRTGGGTLYFATWVPVKATGPIGFKDVDGNPNIMLTNSFDLDSLGNQSLYWPTDKMIDYQHTEYSNDGEIVKSHNPSGDWGDTLYIAGMKIRPTLKTNKSTYNQGEIITWTASGSVESGSERNHKVEMVVKLPKELEYEIGTAKDHKGNPLGDPRIVENSDGTKKLIWVLNYEIADNYNPTVVFDTRSVSSKLNFVSGSTHLNADLTTQVWLEEDPNVTDASSEIQRTTSSGVTILNNGTIMVDKSVDKPFIESGNTIDPADRENEHPTDFTYDIAYRNQGASAMTDVRVLDVLPYNGDARGSDFTGGYTVQAVSEDASGEIWYTNNGVAANIDPNTIILTNGWYRLGSDMSVLRNAKAVLFVYNTIPAGQIVNAKVTLRPNGQEASDVYANAAALNSSLNQFVSGVVSKVRVAGRDLTGIAWYDDNSDGLIGKLANGNGEAFAPNIPVKLYRTSLVNTSYRDELVEESLTGEKFVDTSGNSLIKTDANGKYTFSNLPEGEYIAEFVVGDQVVQKKFFVTKPLVGNDITLNSKADQTTYKTEGYNLPVMDDLVTQLNLDDLNYHVTDVNIGLIRRSTIRLFKYETGTAVDANGDGQLSDVEKASGKALADATFDLYKGNDQTEKVGRATTDVSGYLNFSGIQPGEYNLVETKAPAGYELIKKPIKVTIGEGNQTIMVYQENDKTTELPQAGVNGPMVWLVGIACAFGLAGIWALYYYYDQLRKKGA